MGNSGPEHDLFGEAVPPATDGPVRGRRGAVDLEDWRAWLADPTVRERYWALVYWRGADRCAPWLGTLSWTGHGKVRVGSRSDGSRRMVGAQVLEYQFARGLIIEEADLVLARSCDEYACQHCAHMALVPRWRNGEEYQARQWSGSLLDVRGPRGRAAAVREAILAARHRDEDVEAASAAARAVGEPANERLF